MQLARAAELCEIGSIREYQTSRMKEPELVRIVSAEINSRGQLFVQVAPDGVSSWERSFNVQPASLSIPASVV